jgi:quinol-cytochrome oxidoreductase complex cytochrome b subunit
VTGAVAFIGSIGTAFTGYLSQTNFDSQWTAGQAKDGLNAVGVGSVFNVLDTGQMLLWHVMLLPLLLGVLVVWHVILVRRHGVVPPIGAEAPDDEAALPPNTEQPVATAPTPPAAEPKQPAGDRR